MDNRTLKRMCHLAMFEEYDGKEAIDTCKSFKNDYIGRGLLKNFVIVTIAFILLVGVILLFNFERVAVHIADLNYRPLLWGVLIAYIIMLVIYSIITITIRKSKYERAEKKVAVYERKLAQLGSILENAEIQKDSKESNQ